MCGLEKNLKTSKWYFLWFVKLKYLKILNNILSDSLFFFTYLLIYLSNFLETASYYFSISKQKKTYFYGFQSNEANRTYILELLILNVEQKAGNQHGNIINSKPFYQHDAIDKTYL